MAVFLHLAAVAEIVGHLKDDIRQFQILLPFLIDGLITQKRSKDVASDRAGGITVPAMIDSCDDPC